MAEGLKKTLAEDLTKALKEGQKLKVSVLRLVLADIKNKELEKRNALQDKEIYSILKTITRRYKESISSFKSGGRDDLVKKEEEELNIIQSYLPQELSPEELDKIIESVISETGAGGIKDMGLVMKNVVERVAGRADNKAVSDIVRKKLTAFK